MTVFDLNESQTLSVAEAARALGLHEATVRRAIARGEFPLKTVKVGRGMRVSRVALNRMLEELAEAAS